MKRKPINVEDVKLKSILDAGLTFSAMNRTFEQSSKEKILKKLQYTAKKIFDSASQECFDRVHSEFCRWGIQTIRQSQNNANASYGQIAKTLNVILKVAIYYSHLPNCEASEKISKLLHAAVDNQMMKELKRTYPNDFTCWPNTIAQVDKDAYSQIRNLVSQFIKEKHDNQITPVQFDDIYWQKLNNK